MKNENSLFFLLLENPFDFPFLFSERFFLYHFISQIIERRFSFNIQPPKRAIQIAEKEKKNEKKNPQNVQNE